ncbi:Sodium/nucleoside cotransporter 1 [Galemys pyrenaicus]|uniref:Sodium/nucleoside cotransporter 1 n=1 Tax=Galemys pyrenaicus TaxID=202257 RepID=A0A8J6ASX2_GALPY|nr:Sodium/nucleoside cotransporter 1 [Galemys pyrenaicus]
MRGGAAEGPSAAACGVSGRQAETAGPTQRCCSLSGGAACPCDPLWRERGLRAQDSSRPAATPAVPRGRSPCPPNGPDPWERALGAWSPARRRLLPRWSRHWPGAVPPAAVRRGLRRHRPGQIAALEARGPVRPGRDAGPTVWSPRRGLALAAVLGLVLWLALDTARRPEQLVSFAGVCVLLGILFASSKHHRQVSWRTVSWGLVLQFVLGLFVLRTTPGLAAFRWLGEQIQVFLSYTEAGSSFVFGETLVKEVFAFQVLPIIVFFSCVMSVLYYLGLMQWVILKVSPPRTPLQAHPLQSGPLSRPAPEQWRRCPARPPLCSTGWPAGNAGQVAYTSKSRGPRQAACRKPRVQLLAGVKPAASAGAAWTRRGGQASPASSEPGRWAPETQAAGTQAEGAAQACSGAGWGSELCPPPSGEGGEPRRWEASCSLEQAAAPQHSALRWGPQEHQRSRRTQAKQRVRGQAPGCGQCPVRLAALRGARSRARGRARSLGRAEWARMQGLLRPGPAEGAGLLLPTPRAPRPFQIAWLMQVTMGTTATETLSVAGNIFVSQTEAPLLIRPYLADMTLSEIHVVMTGGYSTIAGSLLGAYISFGIDAASLIAASVMAAPCALALSKLVYPEVEASRFKSKEGVELSYGDAQNLLEAASSGAAISVKVVANIAANLIAFLAVLAFTNAALAWLGAMVDIQGLSFQLLCSYVLRPVAFLMGVAWEDCPVVAELLGIKLFLNEFVAYQELSQYKQHREQGVEEWLGSKKQWISVRAEILTTFALSGFANFSSIGIMLGGLSESGACGVRARGWALPLRLLGFLVPRPVLRLPPGACGEPCGPSQAGGVRPHPAQPGARASAAGRCLCPAVSMAPQRRSDFSRIVLRALFTGACVSLMNACVAGILYAPQGSEPDCAALLNTTLSSTSFEVYQCCRRLFQGPGPELAPVALDNCCRFYNHTACP